jgi:hypothetical protein
MQWWADHLDSLIDGSSNVIEGKLGAA